MELLDAILKVKDCLQFTLYDNATMMLKEGDKTYRVGLASVKDNKTSMYIQEIDYETGDIAEIDDKIVEHIA